jgi:hypothetical protein
MASARAFNEAEFDWCCSFPLVLRISSGATSSVASSYRFRSTGGLILRESFEWLVSSVVARAHA